VPTRRSVLTLLSAALFAPLAAAPRVWGAARKLLPKGTKRESLVSEDPARLDTRDLELTPLDRFGTMGPTDRDVSLDAWRLELGGLVKHPLSLSYAQLITLPLVERDVLLICPGVFANHGRWKGFSLRPLLFQAEFDRKASRVAIECKGNKIARFPLADVLADKVFLAYAVNGKPLPQRNGFPLRTVAQDVFGSEWVKYVDRITVET
jgi:DMSO/TMAO reductase YedYZ molybdopterin-dependent catalytic subunit